MIILITGTRKGIGRSLAEYYLTLEYTVVGCSREDTDLKHTNYQHFKCDITNEKDIKKMVSGIRKKYSYIDILINNAGGASMNHFLFTPTETARKLIELNYLGTFTMCREFSRLQRKSNNPRIINFTTVAKPLNLAGEAAYAASKAAVESLTKIMAKELSMYEITVNAIGPTPIPTDLIAKVPEKKLQKLLQHQPLNRFGSFDDVINVIDFFIKPESNFITGQIIYLGGIS